MLDSKKVSAAAVALAITPDITSEKALRVSLTEQDISSACVNFGGELITSISKIIEHSIVAAKRENVIADSHIEEGVVAGAAHDAISQIIPRALGLNIGGKIAIARSGEHLCVSMYFAVGLLHLNDVAIGLGHRVI